jgi:hypothetical protein
MSSPIFSEKMRKSELEVIESQIDGYSENEFVGIVQFVSVQPSSFFESSRMSRFGRVHNHLKMSTDEEKAVSRRNIRVTRGTGGDADRVRRRLEGFDWETSEAWRILREQFGDTLKSNEIRSIAAVLCRKINGLKLDRDATRDGRVLVKWFQENLPVLQPALKYVALCDLAEQPIGIDAPRHRVGLEGLNKDS